MIAELAEAAAALAADAAVRVVVLTGTGASFCAGGDLAWMRRMAGYSEAENVADAMRLAGMLRAWDTLPRPTIAAVHGACFAGGMGLVAGADIALAVDDSVFCLSEVRLGLVPATISPYVVRAMGARAARRYFLTAERFGVAEALRLGFVHEVVPAGALDEAVGRIAATLAQSATGAQARSKTLIAEVADHPISDALLGLPARVIAEARASEEAREGLAAFFDKRKPSWSQ
jgi:methylglutaconyl-CoA hydratase